MTQIELAKYLDFSNPEYTMEMYPMFPASKSFEENGCKIKSLTEDLFKPLGLNLREYYHSPRVLYNDFDKDMLINLLLGGNNIDIDVLFFLDYATLKDYIDKVTPHAVIMEKFIDENHIHLISPIENYKTKREIITLTKLMQSIFKIKKSGGISLIY